MLDYNGYDRARDVRTQNEVLKIKGQLADILAENRRTPSAAPNRAPIVAPNFGRKSIMSQRDEFDTAGSYVAIKDLLGELVLFAPTEYIEETETSFGTKDAVLTDMVVLTAEGGPAEYTDSMVFQGSLIGQLKRKIPGGRKLLGRIAKGEAKKGQNAPYILAAPSDEDKQLARNYLAGLVVEAAAPKAPADPFAV